MRTNELQRNYTNIAWWMRLSAGFIETADLFFKNNIRFVPLKGLFFNTLIYPANYPRPLGDLDLLVPPEDFKAACDLFLAHGYQQEPALWHLGAAANIPVEGWPTGLSFTVPGSGRYIDLQWQIHERWFLPAFSMDMPALWERVVPASIEPKVPWQWQLSEQDMLSQLCLHCSKDGMAGLKTYRDLDLYIRQLPSDWDWEAWVALVRSWEIGVITWHVLLVLQHYFQTPFPLDLIERFQPSRLRQRLLLWMMPVSAVLSDQPCFGKRFSKVLKLAQIKNPARIWPIVWSTFFPGKNWLLGRYGQVVPIWIHWQHILGRFFDKRNK